MSSDFKLYFEDGTEITTLPDFNTELSSPEGCAAPVDLKIIQPKEITLRIRPLTRLTYEQYKTIMFTAWSEFYRQARTHRKGRVNKKWAKSYGYISSNKRGFDSEHNNL